MFVRTKYLELLKRVKNTPDIKVLMGAKGALKSSILRSFEHLISREFPNSNIIHIDFNDSSFDKLRDYFLLHEYVESHYQIGKVNYLIIIEVENCPNYERALVSLHAKQKYDIYMTGSNDFFEHSKLATLLTGRTLCIPVFPLSFNEYREYYHLSDIDDSFDSYLKSGGFLNPSCREDIMNNLMKTWKYKNTYIMNQLITFLITNQSTQMSVIDIYEEFSKSHKNVSLKLLKKYLSYLVNIHLFYPIDHYDIEDGRVIYSNDLKYYLVDHSLAKGWLKSSDIDTQKSLENVVAIELLRRGYRVYYGQSENIEIDFVAIHFDDLLYIQVLDSCSEEDIRREATKLHQIKEDCSKVIIARTRHPMYQHEGIAIIDIADWLTKE